MSLSIKAREAIFKHKKVLPLPEHPLISTISLLHIFWSPSCLSSLSYVTNVYIILLFVPCAKVLHAVHFSHQLLKCVFWLNTHLNCSFSIYLVDGVLADIVILGLALFEILPRCQKHLREILHIHGLIKFFHLHLAKKVSLKNLVY